MQVNKIFFFIPVLLLSTTMMLSAAKKDEQVKTTYPIAAVILMDAYRYLGSLDHFSLHAITTNDDIYRDIMRKEYTHKIQLNMQRPDKLQVHIRGDIKNRSLYLLNDTFDVIDHDLKFYGELKVPNTIDSALDYLFENYGVKSPLANLLYTDLDKRIAPKTKGYYFGTTSVDGKVCHHIGFVNDQREFQVWIVKGERPLIKKFSIIDKSGTFDLRSTTLLRWDTKARLRKKDFIFKAPKDAEKISIEERGRQ